MRSRNAVQRAIEAQDRARWSAWTERRALQVAGEQAERLTARNLNAGERLGLRRGELEGRIADLEARIGARPGELKDWLAGRLQELGEYRARMEQRIAARADEIAGLDERLPARIEALAPRHPAGPGARLHAYFNDRSEHVVIIPGVATRADFYRGTRPGTPEGEALRFIGQFKTWPAALVRMALGREWYGRGEKGPWRPAAMAGILHMAVAGAILGYGIMVLKDLLKGRNPRDPRSIATWGAALMQGGGLGILGDFLFGEYNRFGQNFSETLLGPVLGQGAVIGAAAVERRQGRPRPGPRGLPHAGLQHPFHQPVLHPPGVGLPVPVAGAGIPEPGLSAPLRAPGGKPEPPDLLAAPVRGRRGASRPASSSPALNPPAVAGGRRLMALSPSACGYVWSAATFGWAATGQPAIAARPVSGTPRAGAVKAKDCYGAAKPSKKKISRSGSISTPIASAMSRAGPGSSR